MLKSVSTSNITLDQNPTTERDVAFMNQALELARFAGRRGEIPVGAIIVKGEEIVGEGFNQKESQCCAIRHAEIVAIEGASLKLSRWRLNDCTLYVTLEPCLMCAGALIQSRIGRVVFGTKEPKMGALVSQGQAFSLPHMNHRPALQMGVCEAAVENLLKEFFKQLRKWKQDSSCGPFSFEI